MKTIENISQYATTYTISQQGNASFRVSFTNNGSDKINHVQTIFGSMEQAKKYIDSCKAMDMLAGRN